MLQTIKNVTELEAIFDGLHGPDGVASSVPMVRSDMLTPEDIAILNQWSVEHVLQVWIDPNVPGMLECLFGLEPAEGEQPFATVGGVPVKATRNSRNRLVTESRVGPPTKTGTYSNLVVRGLWASLPIDSHAFDWGGVILTLQHRGRAYLLARELGAKLPLIHCTFGVPPQFRDYADKAKPRTKIEDTYVDDTILPENLIASMQDERTVIKDRGRERKAMVELRSKIASMVANRLVGKDIPTTGGKQSWHDEQAIAQRCQLLGVESDYNALDWLTVRVYEAGRSQSRKLDRQWLDLFAPSVVGTGLILASNRSYSPPPRESGESPEDYAERSLQHRLDYENGPLMIDCNLVDTILGYLTESTADLGEYASAFETIFAKMRSSRQDTEGSKYLYKPLSLASMSAFVGLVQETLGAKDYSTVWTTYRKDRNGVYSKQYRSFGGLDIGFQEASKKD